jgi:hypothetical protein
MRRTQFFLCRVRRSSRGAEKGNPVRTDGRSKVYMVRGENAWQISADMMQAAPKP